MKFDFGEPQIACGISERKDGTMVWWNKLPVDAEVIKNQRDHFEELGIGAEQVVFGGCSHETNLAKVGIDEGGKYLVSTDALITKQANVFLAITAADCLPVFFYAAEFQIVAIAHAGWRGLTSGILEKVAAVMLKKYGAQPADIKVMIGPHIKACHYSVGPEVAALFFHKNTEERQAKIFVDLGAEAISRLVAQGLSETNIKNTLLCTFCESTRFYSARHDNVNPVQGMLAYIGIRP
jgi:YfiH family protein